ncbi:MAG TPA: molybdate ABC transporter substrate-binding protein [Methylocella sp.]|nr:molybdate ABC transporter substrate-binding protein [Methylocella sp.]
MKLRIKLAVLALSSLFLTTAGRAEEITVAAAADLKFAMDEISSAFQQEHKKERINVVYGSSGKFYTQIKESAPYDIFFSADVGYARSLYSEGLAVTRPALYALGRIVLWSPALDAAKVSLDDLAGSQFQKIAIANPKHAPYGKRAEEALRAAGVWEKVEDKLVFGDNVAQTAQFVESGNAQIGIIALSLALSPELSAKGGYALIPEKLHEPLEQAYVITKHGAASALAKRFVQFMKTPKARRIMVRYGFVLPGETASK